MAPHDEVAQVEERAGDAAPKRWTLGRVGLVVRVVATALALASAWVLTVYGWTRTGDFYSGVFVLALVVATVVLFAVTALVVVSFRRPRLRVALLPIELALVVGVAIFASGTRGNEVDTTDDAASIAMMFSLGALALLSFLSVLLHARPSRERWMAGLAIILAVTGIALPPLLDLLDGSTGDYATEQRLSANFEVMSLYAGPGQFMLGHNPHVVGEGDASSMEPPAHVELHADPAGTLAVVLRGGAHSLAGQRVELRQGRCTAPGEMVARWDDVLVPAGKPSRSLRVTGLDLDDLTASQTLHVRSGSGAPLDDVACSNVLHHGLLVLARSGVGDFFADCIDPLKLEVAEARQLRAESLQDAACSRRLTQLAEVARKPAFRTRAEAQLQANCMKAGSDHDVFVEPYVAGSWTVSPVGADDERAYDCVLGMDEPSAIDPATGDPATGLPIEAPVAVEGHVDEMAGAPAVDPGS